MRARMSRSGGGDVSRCGKVSKFCECAMARRQALGGVARLAQLVSRQPHTLKVAVQIPR